MDLFTLVEPNLEHEEHFIKSMRKSEQYHYPWVNPPKTSEDYLAFLERYQQPNQKSFLLLNNNEQIIGVFNINEIVRGFFQSAYLGFYGIEEFSGMGYMNIGLKLVLSLIFGSLELHRIEANIQPDNLHSIKLVEKNGFKKEGFSPKYLKINGIWQDHSRYALTIEDFIFID